MLSREYIMTLVSHIPSISYLHRIHDKGRSCGSQPVLPRRPSDRDKGSTPHHGLSRSPGDVPPAVQSRWANALACSA